MKSKTLIPLLLAAAFAMSGCGGESKTVTTQTPDTNPPANTTVSSTSSSASSSAPSSSSPSASSSASIPDPIVLTGIDLSGDYPIVFEEGEDFSYAGLIVTATYSDSSHKAVTGFTVSPANPTDTAGEKTITVSYSEGGVEVSATYKITVNESHVDPEQRLAGIRLDVSGVNRSFNVNSAFSSEGLVVTAVYADAHFATVNPTNIIEPDMAVTGIKNVIVEYAEGGVTASSSYKITVHEATHADENVIKAAIAELHASFSSLDIDDYGEARWNNILDKLKEANDAISCASSNEEVQSLLDAAVQYFESVPKAGEAAIGTLFDYQSSEANYEFDRDDEGRLVIMYPGYPGNWVYCGTKTNLHTNINENNTFALTFRNDSANGIEVCLQLTNDSTSYKVDSHVIQVAPGETKTITLEYEIEVTRLFFFLDSCSAHDRSGQVTILSTEFSLTEHDVELLDPKTIQIEQSLTRSDNGANTYYTIQESDSPLYIERISFKLEVLYNGNGDSGKWFGVVLQAGSYKSEQMKESMGYAQGIDGGNNFIFNCEIDGVLSAGDSVHASIAYGAGPTDSHPELNELSYKVLSYTFHYGTRKPVASETVDVNQYIWQNGASKVDDVKLKATIPFSSFSSRSRVTKIAVNFTTVNHASYGKSNIYVTGFDFTNFSSDNNLLNIGSQMLTDRTGNPQSGTAVLYPIGNVSLSENGQMSLECWWTCADSVLIDSVTVYYDMVAAPGEVSSLEAHPINEGVVLTWLPGSYADSYRVYCDETLLGTTGACYYTVDGLANDQSYTFSVVSVNTSGESNPVSVVSAPDAEGVYDTFIESLNTPLEQYLGETRVGQVLEGGNYYLSQSNNYRFKQAIAKMQRGETTNFVYMGGSITVGETALEKDENEHQKGYAYYSYQWLKRNYDPHGVSTFTNASISGTGSDVGIARLQEDVIGHNPDVVFLECAANNGSTEYYKATYESEIRRLLSLPSAPAVVLVFSCTYYTGPNGPEYRYMSDIGYHYGLPMFSLDRGMRAICTPSKTDGVVGDEVYARFSDDGTHPNDQGHQLYAKALCYYLRSLIAKQTDAEPTVPNAPCNSYGAKYENFVSCTSNSAGGTITSMGSFAAADTATPSTSLQSDVTAFQHGWKKASGTNEAMKIEVNAKNFVLVYEAGNPRVAGDPTGNIIVSYRNKNDASDSGSLTWDVTKTCSQSNSGSNAISQSGSGWQNPVAIWLFDKAASADYEITIQMEQASDICVIMAFGYTA